MAAKLLKLTGALLALFNLVNVINSSWFFLGTVDFPVNAWLAFNACAPSVAVYLAGYFLKKEWLMAAALPLMLFFGTGGLFIFGWTGTAIYAQAGHILMTFASIWIIAKIVAGKKLKQATAGFMAGAVVFALIMPVQQQYVMSHPEYIKKLGDCSFEEFINKKR